MDLVDQIHEWQKRARAINPPENSKIEAASDDGLKGRAFFPEGLGLQRLDRTIEKPWPNILVVGHYFGTSAYRDKIEKKCEGSEDSKTTWSNLKKLLGDARLNMDRCFMTNWFIGFGPKQIGALLKVHDTCGEGCSPSEAECSIRRYEKECRNLIIDQIRVLKPKAILLLGKEVIRRAHNIAPNDSLLVSWSKVSASSLFRGVDAIKNVPSKVPVLGANVHTNFVALVHPSDHRNLAFRGNPPPGRPSKEAWKERKKAGREFEIGLIKNSLK